MSLPTPLTKQNPQRPSAAILHGCLLLAGLATALLGPILPLLSLRWHLSDQQSGLLLLAQFCGATTGGLTVSKRLSRSLTFGLAAAATGFTAFSIAPGLLFACIALFAAGWGVGQLITASNITAGRRYATHRGSALALLNFSFSLGAMLSPLLAAQLTPHFTLRSLLTVFAAAFAVVLARLLFELRTRHPDPELHAEKESPRHRSRHHDPALRAGTESPRPQSRHSDPKRSEGEESPHFAPTENSSHPSKDISPTESRLPLSIYLYFALLLFLYGGVETSLDGWLTTFALRYGNRTLAISQYTTLLLWASLTAGRALSSLLLLKMREAALQRATLVLTTICIAALVVVHGTLPIALLACLLGLSLAPFFPSTFALLMADKPSARQAGVVLAMSGLGAAFLPSLMGVISTRTGSLQTALAIPLAAAIALLALAALPPGVPTQIEPSS